MPSQAAPKAGIALVLGEMLAQELYIVERPYDTDRPEPRGVLQGPAGPMGLSLGSRDSLKVKVREAGP